MSSRGSKTQSPTQRTTTEASYHVSLSRVPAEQIPADEPIVVFPPNLRSTLAEASITDGPVRVGHSLREWESRPPALAEIDSVTLKSPDQRFDGQSFALDVEWGPIYNYPFEIQEISETNVPEKATVIRVSDQPSAIRNKLADAIDSGYAEFTPLEDVYHLLVSEDEKENKQSTVAYLHYESNYYEVKQRAFTPTPTDRIYLEVTMHATDSGSKTLALSSIDSRVRQVVRTSLERWANGKENYTIDELPDRLQSFMDRFRYIMTFSNAFQIQISQVE